ncbi:MAG: T9SS type B sorting domain-containing protein, partial [Tenacibaculum sp.]
ITFSNDVTYDATTGKITVPAGVTGGTGAYTRYVFVYDNGTPADTTDDVTQDSVSDSFSTTNISGGTVAITVYDAQGCSGSTTGTINALDVLSNALVTVDDPLTCTNDEDITVSFSSISGNAADITIEGVNGTVYAAVTQNGTSGDFDDLPVGEYKITIAHATSGCELEIFHTVTAVPTYNVIANNTTTTCFGDNYGTVDISFNGATSFAGNYTYVIKDNNGTQADLTDDNDITATTTADGVGVGNVVETVTGLLATPVGFEYYVELTMTDTPFCTIQSNPFTIEQPAALLALNTTLTYINCNPNNSGEVVLEGLEGWGSYEYQLVNDADPANPIQNFDKNTIITGLVAGSYTATVRDGQGCTAVQNFTLDAPEDIQGEIRITPNTCNGETTATIEVFNVTGGQDQGGTPSYTYILEYPNGVRTASQSAPIFTNLPADNGYVIIIEDAAYSCNTRIEPINIIDPTKVEVTARIVSNITCDTPQAVVEVTGMGGTAPYMFSVDGMNWVPANNGATHLFNVDAGEHQFYTRDAVLCVSEPSFTITIDAYDALVPSLNVISGFVTCNGDNNGALSASASGGFGNYQYQLLDASSVPYTPIGAYQDSDTFTDLLAGTYAIRVSSTNDAGDVCEEDTTAHTITEPDAIILTETHTNVNCFGGDDGTITITPAGGNGTVPEDYEYNISTDSPNKFVKNNVFEHLPVGIYTITVKDKVGCYETITVEIEQPDELTITLVNVVEQTCLNDPTPTITVDVQGGTAPYFISVNNGTPFGPYANSGNITIGAAEGIEGGQSYIISVSDSGAGCSPEPLPLLTTDTPIDLELTVDYAYTCPSGNIILAMVADNYKNSMSYTLYESGNAIITNNTGEFIDVPAGEYTVTATHTISSCSENSTSTPITIVDYDPITFTVDTSIKNQLHVNAVGGNDDYMYSFDGGATWTDQNWTWIYETRDYQIIVKDSREETGCPVEQTIEGIYVTIKVPNLFSPDGDNDADYWYPLEVEDYHNLRVFIYDRYARKIVNFKGTQQGWDGTYEGKPLPSGDYWYTIYYNELSGEEKKIMGHFTLYR